ncbi:MAG: methylmalonyl-CoA epimerase [Chlorobi bacterium]|nr:methylmalonyl-CoA epimerase [Chlorobiota bacterium]
MIRQLAHIGIAVSDIEKSVDLYRRIFQPDEIHREVVPEQKVEVASFVIGNVRIELVAPMSDDSPIARFLQQRGEGIHHLAFESNEISADLVRLKESGIVLLNEHPTQGAHNMAIAFLHPKTTGGVLIELCQRIEPQSE